MGCPLCKNQPPPSTGLSGLDNFIRKSSLRSSRPVAAATTTTTLGEQQSGLRNCKLEFQQSAESVASEEPPIYFLSGNPALRAPVTPPKKAPRTSGWKDATLRATVATEVASEPSRPPRRRQHRPKSPAPQQQQVKRISSKTEISKGSKTNLEVLPHSLSASSLGRDLAISDETVNKLEEYLRKNQSVASLHLLLTTLQAQTQSNYASSSADEEEHWDPTSLDMSERPISPPPAIPTRKRRSIEKVPPSYPPPPPPAEETDESSEHDSLVLRGHWEDQNDIQCIIRPHDIDHLRTNFKTPSPILKPPSPLKLSPSSPKSPTRNRLTPMNLCRLAEEVPSQPATPGPWFDRGENGFPSSPNLKRYSPNQLIVNRSSSSLREELTPQVTPPPSETDEFNEEVMPPEITHSILLKILQQCSDDFGKSELISRRASIIPSNIPLDGLHEFIKNMQQHDEKDEEDLESDSPSIGELEKALSEMLETEKLKEKEEQKTNVSELQAQT